MDLKVLDPMQGIMGALQTANVMNQIKAGQQQSTLNALKLRDYEEDRKTEKERNQFKLLIESFTAASKLDDPKAAAELVEKTTGLKGIKFKSDGVKTTADLGDATIETTPEGMKAATSMFQADPSGWHNNIDNLKSLAGFGYKITPKEKDKSEYKPGKIMEFKVGDEIVTKELQPDGKTWKEIGKARRYKPSEGKEKEVNYDKNIYIAAQAAGVDPEKIRKGQITQDEAMRVLEEYKKNFGSESLLEVLFKGMGQAPGGVSPVLKLDANGNPVEE